MFVLYAAAISYLLALGSVSLSAAAQSSSPPAQPSNALPAVRSGADIFGAACATCHGRDGRGAPPSLVGFDTEIRDFTDCTASAEPTPDWYAVVHEGGPIRALDRHMPAFGEALTGDDISRVVDYLRTFCAEQEKWPSGDLNFPRAFFTEKAFPENEAVWTMSIQTRRHSVVGNTVLFERRLGARSQFEMVVPVDFAVNREVEGKPWIGGIGDVAVAVRHAFLASSRTGTIASAGGEVVIPTGNTFKDLGKGYVIYEPFAMVGQMLPRNGFLQMHGGFEFPSDWRGMKEGYLRTAVGTTFTQDRGFGRSWSPQVELLYFKPFGAPAGWDLVPQLQVSLSKLQHVLLSGGVRVPLNAREVRQPQLLMGVVWDWFDGGLFEFWR